MSEQRWAVLGTETMNGWLVVHPGDILRMDDGRLECWDVHSRHHTWEEAMQEADRMARTVSVTLPRVGDIHALPLSSKAHKEDPILVSHDPPEVRIRYSAQGTTNTLCLFRDELEPVARVLLAHARRKDHS